jgi:hypothetical protein
MYTSIPPYAFMAQFSTGNFSIHVILPASLGPLVHSASIRNEYQKQKNDNVSGE